MPPHRARDEAVLWAGLLLATAIVLAVAAAAGIDHGCRSSPPPISGPPESGTPRAAYCAGLDGEVRWLVLLVVPWALVALTTLALRRRAPLLPIATAAVACAAACVNWLVFNGLDWVPTV